MSTTTLSLPAPAPSAAPEVAVVAGQAAARERDFSGEAGREHRVDPAWSVQLG